MATIALTADKFSDTVKSDGIVFVDFWATWCPPCRMFGPVFESASETNPDLVFAKVDTDAEQQLAGALEISSIPTLMAFRDGYLVFRQAGALGKGAFENLIQQVRDLDMDKLKAEAAKD
ncbi:MAG: thioredoxin [Propionibacteriaceae bacterium]|jgi:thioredoxin 1|nr:thioredoxin [Propionibacteriaceae bacterium]